MRIIQKREIAFVHNVAQNPEETGCSLDGIQVVRVFIGWHFGGDCFELTYGELCGQGKKGSDKIESILEVILEAIKLLPMAALASS